MQASPGRATATLLPAGGTYTSDRKNTVATTTVAIRTDRQNTAVASPGVHCLGGDGVSLACEDFAGDTLLASRIHHHGVVQHVPLTIEIFEFISLLSLLPRLQPLLLQLHQRFLNLLLQLLNTLVQDALSVLVRHFNLKKYRQRTKGKHQARGYGG
jgi:hypothetical protein